MLRMVRKRGLRDASLKMNAIGPFGSFMAAALGDLCGGW